MLEVKDATIALGDKVLARDLSFTAMDGELTCVSGPKGSGKTVLLRVLMGFLPVNEGFVSVDGELLTVQSAHAFRKMMCYLPQQIQLLRHQLEDGSSASSEAVEAEATPDTDEYAVWNSAWPVANKEAAPEPLSPEEIMQLAEQTLKEAADKPIVIVDEPIALLPSELSMRMIQLLKSQAQAGKTVLVTSSKPQVADYADKVITL